MIEKLIENPDVIRELGFSGIFVVALLASCVYFAPIIKKYLEAKITGSVRIEQIIDNNTAALHTIGEALRSNADALRENCDERDTATAIIREHDRASDLRFQEQNASLARIENQLGR